MNSNIDLTLLSHADLLRLQEELSREAEKRDYKITNKLEAAKLTSARRIARAREAAGEAAERYKQTELGRIERQAQDVADQALTASLQAERARSLATRFHLALENIGPSRGWVATLSLGPDGRFNRAFVRGQVDYEHSNSIGTRGVMNHFYLEESKLYEVNAPHSWKRTDRYFCRVEDRQLVTMEYREAVQWLSDRSA